MGIPSYFSYIVKNHPNIIQQFVKKTMKINNLYLDCNSIIYDAVHELEKLSQLPISMNNSIIQHVIQKIDFYISLIEPNEIAFIAFDGVAPVAKLNQQRERRYKSWYQNEITKKVFKRNSPDPWNTTAITPGTAFMKELSERVQTYYKYINSSNTEKSPKKIIVSTSDDYGEGEHKIFDYIRNHPDLHNTYTTVIYGLDADLIMLSINHLPVSPKIYLFRETPHFIQSIDSSLEPNAHYLLDIPDLATAILEEMNPSSVRKNNLLLSKANNEPIRIYDYIFLCFFLGNDFMPHFPTVNIRTGGVDKMLNAYKATIGRTMDVLTDGKTIYWKHVRTLVSFLADQEEDFFKKEMKLRDRRSKTFYPIDTPENIYKKFEALPNYERDIEKYINPYQDSWQKRYYHALFHVDSSNTSHIQEICINYMEGLEWTMKYYTTGCPDWRWTYSYHYPPLLCDLIKHLPYFEKEFVPFKAANPVSKMVQLCYVVPKSSLYLLPKELYEPLILQKWYPTDCNFLWAFCRYFWESHVELPVIEMDQLEIFVNDYFTKYSTLGSSKVKEPFKKSNKKK